jgi:hypothetical protein
MVLGFLAYSNTFTADFHFDDKQNIVNNPIIKDMAFFLEPSKALHSFDKNKYYALNQRYIAYLTFALNYKIHGLHVTGYHIFNLAVHLFNALLVYWLVLLTGKTPFFADRITQNKEAHRSPWSCT